MHRPASNTFNFYSYHGIIISMQFQDFIDQFHIRLNAQQMEAVRTVNGPVLLLAVPGSGKTTVLVTRLGYMIYCLGIAPESILTLTYTRAAAADMSQRFMSIFGSEMSGRIEFRTINSICDRIIRYYAYEVDGRRPFTLESNEKTLNGIVSMIYQKVENTYPTENDIKNARTLITYIKNMGIPGNELEEFSEQFDFDIAKIYKEYQAIMRGSARMDYDDQMVYAYNILRRSPKTLAYFQSLFPYICVDEAQDTSKIQHSIISVLAGRTSNLFMVGDEDQSIYGFRAAYPDALLNFEKDHPGAKILLMEENFRSTGEIVRAAERLIRHNTLRHEKHMITHRNAGNRIKKITVSSRSGQYAYLIKVAQNITANPDSSSAPQHPGYSAHTVFTEDAGHPELAYDVQNSIINMPCPDNPPEYTAVLYRNNESAIPLIDSLERLNIPYRIQNRDLLFFTHRTIMDLRNIAIFACNPSDTELFMQIYYKIGLYINKKEAETACAQSLKRRISVLDALEDYCGLSGFRITRVRAARTNLRKMLEEPAQRAVSRILKALEYQAYLERSGISDEKINLLRILSYKEPDIASLFERLDWLKQRIQTKEDDLSCPFILSTIHSSKGLEYDNVFLIDCFDGVFPQSIPDNNQNADDEDLKAFEEERRMFYVAVTRAKNNLSLFTLQNETHTFTDELTGDAGFNDSGTGDKSTNRRNYGQRTPGPKNYGIDDRKSYGQKASGQKAAWQKNSGQKISGQNAFPSSQKNTRSIRDYQKDYENFCSQLGHGIVVTHKKFGEGIISDIDDDTVTIYFDDTGEKKFHLELLFMKDLLQLKSD